jgi:hypothetical protein
MPVPHELRRQYKLAASNVSNNPDRSTWRFAGISVKTAGQSSQYDAGALPRSGHSTLDRLPRPVSNIRASNRFDIFANRHRKARVDDALANRFEGGEFGGRRNGGIVLHRRQDLWEEKPCMN